MFIGFLLIAAVCIILEAFFLRHFFFRRVGWVTDGTLGLCNVLIRALMTHTFGLFLGSALALGSLHMWPPIVQAALVLVVLDFIGYWLHRLKHRVGWLWNLHRVHHTTSDLDWLASVRFHPLEKICDRLVYLGPLALLGPSADGLMIFAFIEATISTLSHSKLKWNLWRLDWLIVTPKWHHWHHSARPADQMTNFSNSLAIFDYIFGTASRRSAWPSEYGETS